MTFSTVPVIFDLDGTLVDPAGGITDGIAAALSALDLPVPHQSDLDSMVGPRLSDALIRIAGVPAGQVDEVIGLYRAYYRTTGISRGSVYPGIRDLLESLRNAGTVMAVATQKPESLARVVLEHHGLDGFFTSIQGSSDDESGVPGPVPSGKADIIAAAMGDLGATGALMVGDRAQDVAGALANGIDCIGVAWGFAPDGELVRAGACTVVADTQELHAAIIPLATGRAEEESEV